MNKQQKLEQWLHSRIQNKNWSIVNRRLSDFIVESGHNCGRFIVVNIKGYFFMIHDGAFDIYTVSSHNPEPEQVESNALKVVAIALKEGFKLTVSYDSELDVVNSTEYNEIFDSLSAVDGILNLTLSKRKTYGTFAVCLFDLDDDENIIDYTANPVCDRIFNQATK